MSAIVIWRPEPLTARLMAAASPARSDVARLANMRAPGSIKVQVLGESVGTLHPAGLFHEFGTKPHTIEPKGKVLKLADGGFVSGPVKHPGMKATPFLRPAKELWPTAYRRQAMGAFRGI